MGKFAKLIELENEEQVLVTLEASDGDDVKCELSISTDTEACRATIKMGFDSLEKGRDALERYNKTDAELFRKDIMKLIG